MQPELLSGNDPLDQLRPIILPEHGISWWPMAPGWWILLGLLLILIILAFWLRPKFLAQQAEKNLRESTLHMLEALYLECRSETEPSLALQYYLQKSNDIFKRVVNHYASDESPAALCGEDWIQFLKKIPLPQTASCANLYGNQLYSRQCTENVHLEMLHRWACAWIQAFYKHHQKLHRKPG